MAKEKKKYLVEGTITIYTKKIIYATSEQEAEKVAKEEGLRKYNANKAAWMKNETVIIEL